MGTSRIEFHRGETLMRLANYYPSLLLTLVECVQNAIDAGADRIMLCIDLQSSNRQVIVVDNGGGVTKDRFELALSSVGFSIKRKGSLGKFGLGLISPLNKCTSFSFTSAEQESRSALRWSFAQADIRQQCDQLDIPCSPIPGLPVLAQKFRPYATDDFAQQWRTMIHMRGVTKDKVTSLVDLDELESQIHTKLGQPMRDNKVSVRVVLFDDHGKLDMRDITPMSYSGEPLDLVAYDQDDTGRVEFELYRAPKRGGKRSGKVLVMSSADSSGISMREFATQAWGRRSADLLKDAVKVLESGYFEGVIRCENLVLLPERTKFELSDALDMLYLVIAQWYDEVGMSHYQVEQEETRDSRNQAIAVKASQRLRDELLSRPEYSRLMDGLKSVVEFGRLGTGHLTPENGKPNGLEDETTIRSGQGGAGKSRTPSSSSSSGGGSRERTRQPKDRPGDFPVGARGPHGQRRKLVKGDSQGLWFGYEESVGNSQLWQFDRTHGALILNTFHPIWVKLDDPNARSSTKIEKQIQHLLEWLAIEVLHLLVFSPDEAEFEHNRALIDNKIRHYVEMFVVPPRTR